MSLKKYYDGRDQYLDIIGGQQDESPLLKELKYKLSPDPSIDIDVSKWAIDNYVRKYEFLKDGRVSLQKSSIRKYEIILSNEEQQEVYRGDTMTSFATIFKYYMNNINPIYNKYFRGIRGLAEQILKEKDWDEFKAKIDPEIIEFAELVRTEGNFIPVPVYFNVERSGSFADRDYWDLVMKAVYDWYEIYHQNDDTPLRELLGCKNNHIDLSVQYCKKWLDHFDNWNEFIEKNYLKFFVNENQVPIEFWENHFKVGNKITSVNSREQFITFMKLLNGIIRSRNEIMEEK